MRAVVLTGAGEVFCAGADIGEMRAAGAAPPEQNEADSRRFARMLECIERQPQPTVALVNGAAYGGAVGLVAACDIALAARRRALRAVRGAPRPRARDDLALRHPRHRHARGAALVPDRRGDGRGDCAAHRPRPRDRGQPATLGAAADGILRALLAGAPGAQAEIKRLVRHATGRSEAGDDAMLADTARWIARVRAGAEAREGLTAFLERRKPGWIRDP